MSARCPECGYHLERHEAHGCLACQRVAENDRHELLAALRKQGHVGKPHDALGHYGGPARCGVCAVVANIEARTRARNVLAAPVSPTGGSQTEAVQAIEPDAQPFGSPVGDDDDVVVLEISTRALNVLYNGNVRTVADLCARTRKDLLALRHCGKRTVKEVQEALAARGRTLAGRTRMKRTRREGPKP